MIPLDEQLRPTWLFGKTVHEGCDRGRLLRAGRLRRRVRLAASASSSSAAGGRSCSATSASAAGWAASAAAPTSAASASAAPCPASPTSSCRSWTSRPGAKLSTDGRRRCTAGRSARCGSFTQASMNREPEWRHPRAELSDASTELTPERKPDDVRHDQTAELVEMSWDPITRIVGSLGIHTKIDFANRRVVECHSTSSIFRGYSIFMKGKDPRDAHFITSRICGICGDNHATCAVLRPEHGLRRPAAALAEWIINLGEAAEYMFDHNLFQDNLVGVDFCEQMVKETNPGVLAKAETTPAPHADLHGYRTIADIMRALNPFTGAFYREALQMSRLTREMFCLMEGRHVHPSTLYPGGVGTVPTRAALHRLPRPADEVRRVHEEGRAAARRPVRLLLRGAARLRGGRPAARAARLLGLVQQPRTSATTPTRRMTEWGRAMYVTPGVVVDGELVTTDLVDINLGIRILLGSSFYDDWQDGETFVKTDPLGNPVDQRHPVEPDDDAAAAEARLRRQVHLGHVAALVRQAHRRAPGARHRRRAARPLLGRRRWPGWSTSATSRRPGTASRSTCPRRRRCRRSSSSGRFRSGATRSSATGPGPTSRPTRRRRRCTSSSRRCRRCTPAGRRPGPSSRCPTRPSAAASTRRCAACSRTTS